MSRAVNHTLTSTHDDESLDGRIGPLTYLFLVLDCERLLAPSARLCLSHFNQVWIGRGDTLDLSTREQDGQRIASLHIPERRASSQHLKLEYLRDAWTLIDHGSKNGTYVNATPCERTELLDGEIIEIGRTFFLFRIIASSDSDGPSRGPKTDRSGVFARPYWFETSRLNPPAPGLATMNPQLASHLADLVEIAPSRASVLIRGASGTGKELLARAAHRLSDRPGQLVAVNCGALTPTLIEAELFGHARGAFSGATEARRGYIRQAERGTLFLDEIGDLPLPAQATLLRVLQQREVVPVGESQPIPVDFRLVAATHRDLPDMVERGEFRDDLLGRITAFTAHLPSLFDRREDLGLLLSHLLGRIAGLDAPDLTLSFKVARALLFYQWPRNIREFENYLEAAVPLARDHRIQLEHLPRAVRRGPAREPSANPERDQLADLLRQHQGNVSAVARALNTSRSQVHREMKRLGLRPEAFRA